MKRSLQQSDPFTALKECAMKMDVDIKKLPNMNEFSLLKAIKKEIILKSNTPTPFDELENKPIIFKINYAHHFGVPKDEIMQKLGVTSKRVVDSIWFYNNKSYRHKVIYKQKVLDFLESQKLKS